MQPSTALQVATRVQSRLATIAGLYDAKPRTVAKAGELLHFVEYWKAQGVRMDSATVRELHVVHFLAFRELSGGRTVVHTPGCGQTPPVHVIADQLLLGGIGLFHGETA